MLSRSILIVPLQDFLGHRQKIYDNITHTKATLNWIKRAQDIKKSGGVSTGYSLLGGWLPEYIETTGYIISSFLEASLFFRDVSYQKRALRMADFLVSMQLPSGGFRTYPPSVVKNSKPTIFNTAQDIIGMVDIYIATKRKKYLISLTKAANFLLKNQNNNGSWTNLSYDGDSHSYDTRVAYALIKAYKVTKDSDYLKVAIKNLNWVLSLQKSNGWFRKATLPPPNPINPYTHTIAYTIEGLLLSGLAIRKEKFIFAAKKTSDVILEYFLKFNYLPGSFDNNWKSSDRYSCLTGNAQISGIWLRLFNITKEKKYLNSAKKLNNYLKSCQTLKINDLNIKGGIKGSQPIYGDLLKGEGYCRLTYINWAAKYFVDSLLLEEMIKKDLKPLYI